MSTHRRMTHPSHSILPTWTPEREARALRLYLREDFTAAEVADALGCGFSRAAVIGKIRRLGFLKRDTAAAAAPSAAAKFVCRPRIETRLPPRRPPAPMPPLREVPPTGVPRHLAGLSANSCRWPIDDPGPGRMHTVLFCAGPATHGAYCAAHFALAHAR
jgi:GcrA cell cycle regulator